MSPRSWLTRAFALVVAGTALAGCVGYPGGYGGGPGYGYRGGYGARPYSHAPGWGGRGYGGGAAYGYGGRGYDGDFHRGWGRG
ncbi:hypothetical protein [Roseomonas indoligenes]|uniref:Lipoprotein n=1 Tax=Roseomonas indoligenes TaxID=2820811 RepID=A0A940N6X8_9PROT|nr:hypothetical protein [Pararoseomonas indoligenes]MBP0496250.1 hypothetical protein [Pararoseomonas indoligenes]